MTLPVVVAHRGIHEEHPENSVQAFLAAWHAGIIWCECDVRGSREHEPFILHDSKLDRTTDMTGLVEQTPSEILHRTMLRREDGSLSTACVPRFSTTIKAMPAGAKFLIEIKPKVHPEVVRRTLELCDQETCVVQSFDLTVLRQCAAERPEFQQMLLVDDARCPESSEEGPWTQINANFKHTDAAAVQAIRSRGLKVGIWTPNEEGDISRVIALEPDMIISDRPLLVRDLLRKIG